MQPAQHNETVLPVTSPLSARAGREFPARETNEASLYKHTTRADQICLSRQGFTVHLYQDGGKETLTSSGPLLL